MCTGCQENRIKSEEALRLMREAEASGISNASNNEIVINSAGQRGVHFDIHCSSCIACLRSALTHTVYEGIFLEIRRTQGSCGMTEADAIAIVNLLRKKCPGKTSTLEVSIKNAGFNITNI